MAEFQKNQGPGPPAVRRVFEACPGQEHRSHRLSSSLLLLLAWKQALLRSSNKAGVPQSLCRQQTQHAACLRKACLCACQTPMPLPSALCQMKLHEKDQIRYDQESFRGARHQTEASLASCGARSGSGSEATLVGTEAGRWTQRVPPSCRSQVITSATGMVA